jgi:hypothetical protein
MKRLQTKLVALVMGPRRVLAVEYSAMFMLLILLFLTLITAYGQATAQRTAAPSVVQAVTVH